MIGYTLGMYSTEERDMSKQDGRLMVVFGILLLSLGAFIGAAVTHGNSVQAQDTSSQIGRYQVSNSKSPQGASVVIIDTSTGIAHEWGTDDWTRTYNFNDAEQGDK